MEESVNNTPLDSTPMYFFDQLKRKIRIWKKEACKDHTTHPNVQDGAKDPAQDLTNLVQTTENSEGSKKAKLTTITLPEKEEKPPFRVSISEPPPALNVSESTAVSKLPPNPKFSKMHLQKSLFEEYKLTAPEILSELETILRKYAKFNITFPVGIVNLMNYSWQDLTEDSYKHALKKTMLEQDKALRKESTTITIYSLKERKTSNPATEPTPENHSVVKPKKIHHVISNKSSEKTPHTQCSQIFHGSQGSLEKNVPLVLHFSLLSKTCLQNGWILHPYSKLEILKWKTVLRTALKRLQVARVQRKIEEDKLKREGFDKQLILRHYNEPESDEETIHSQHPSQHDFDQASLIFWMNLLEKRPQIPTVKKDDPEMKKFHYALVDGSSLTYYPSGRLAVCQSFSDLPLGGMYTNIFSDLPNPDILGTFTPFGYGSISFPNRTVIAVMFNQEGGIVLSKKGNIIREWIWPSKGKLEDPIEIGVNKFITVNISGRFAITLVYKWHLESLKLPLVSINNKRLPPSLHDKHSSLVDPVDKDSVNPTMDISPMRDLEMSLKLGRLQRRAKHILLHWLNYYKYTLGLDPLLMCNMPIFPQKEFIKPKVTFEKVPPKQDAKETDKLKAHYHYQKALVSWKGAYKLSPHRLHSHHRRHRTPAINQPFRFPPIIKDKDLWFVSKLVCPVVLRKILCGLEGDICQCSSCNIPEVTDLEYDQLISNKKSSVDQVIIVCVFSNKEKDGALDEMASVYKKLNRTRHRPCIQGRLDPFRLLKYNIMSASKLTGSNCPLLVQRHNIIPGIFLMYIQGKLLFANFIFNGYSTSAKDLQKQIVKTRNDYNMGYFLPSDFRIRQCQSIQLTVLPEENIETETDHTEEIESESKTDLEYNIYGRNLM